MPNRASIVPYSPQDYGYVSEATEPDLVLSRDKPLFTVQTRILRGERFSFNDRNYLLPIYRDESNRIKIVKGRQMEFSELLVNWLYANLWSNPNTIGLYMSDRDSHTSKFSNLRIKEWTIRASPVIQKITPLPNHTATELKFVNGSILYFHSAWGDFVQARSIPADFAAIDERQDVNGESVDVLLESMSHSKFGKMIEVGTGSDEDTDWHKSFLRSDMKEWDRQSNSWIPQKPENSSIASGYHVSQAMAPWISAEELKQKELDRTPRYYTTEVLGWFYHGLKKPITTAMMRELYDYSITLTRPSQVDHTLGPVFMGIDYGGGDHAFTVPWIEQKIMTTGENRLLWTEKMTEKDVEKQAEHLAYLIREYKPLQVVQDAGGGIYQTQQLEKAFGDQIRKCYYIRTPKASEAKDYRFRKESMPLTLDRKHNSVSVNRTWIIDVNISEIKSQKFMIPAQDEPAVDFVLDHFTAIESVLVKSATGDYTTYDHDNEHPDDALHARNYKIIAEMFTQFKHKSKIGVGTLGSKRR